MKQSIILVFISLFILTACHSPKTKTQQNTITVSIAPQKYFVDAISNKSVKVNIFIPAGASPATYEPSPQQMFDLQKSTAYIAMGGLGFEQAWLPKLLAQNKNLKAFYANKGININKEHKNPHIWLSPKRAKIIAQNTFEALSSSFPENKTIYKQNLDNLITEIDSLDTLYSQKLGQLKHKSFMIFHPALYYLAKDYGLTQIAIEENGKVPSPQHLMNMVELAKKQNIRLIFIQKEFDVENAQLIAQQCKAKIVQLNLLNADWKQQQLDLLQQLVNNLK